MVALMLQSCELWAQCGWCWFTCLARSKLTQNLDRNKLCWSK